MALIPVLIVGDAVSSSSGLGRIAREIAVREAAHLSQEYRVATLGYGGPGSRKFNFPQYSIEGMQGDFVIPNLPDVWEDWAGKEAGAIFFIWDASRLGWFSRPKIMCQEQSLKLFLNTAKIERWIYAPVDGGGPNQRLSYPLVQALLGFDRILAYGQWAKDTIQASLGEEPSMGRDLSFVPHGIDSSVFFPRDRAVSKMNFFALTGASTLRGTQGPAILSDEPLIGTIATNQTRKDWGLWAQISAMFLRSHPKARFWIHTDTLERHWSIPALLVDFGLMERTVISLGFLEDHKMAQAYSACDLTLACGPEGFGYCIFESLFCGTPCIHGNYAGAPEHMEADLLVNPVAYRLEGMYASQRPVFRAKDWMEAMELNLGKRVQPPRHLDWENVWPKFEAWFRKGLTQKGTDNLGKDKISP